MTDKEIIQALERIAQYSGFTDDVSNTLLSALDLINRQQAEIKELKSKVFGMEFETAMYKAISESARVKSIKEFAEKLKDVFVTIDGTFECWEIEEHIDNLVQEMVGADNG